MHTSRRRGEVSWEEGGWRQPATAADSYDDMIPADKVNKVMVYTQKKLNAYETNDENITGECNG
jgi:hypothetical protein